MTEEAARKVWRGNEALFAAAMRASETGESLDVIYSGTFSSFSRTSNGSLSILPRISQSKVTSNR